MTAAVFLSHASKDRKVAETICQAVESRGVQCWMSNRDVHPGENFQEAIVRAIRAAKVMLFVFSANSNNSDEVKKEIALAGANKLFVVPLRVEDVAPNEALLYELATRQWIDLFNDWESSLDQVMAQIKALTAMQTTEEPSVAADGVEHHTAPQPTPDLEPVYEQANAHARAGEYDQAIEQYNQVIAARPDHANALNNRGNALLAKGQGEQAILDFDRAIALKPDFAAAYCNRGNAFQSKGDYDKAIRDYTVALQLKPDLAAALNNRAATYERKGLHDMARKDRAAAAQIGRPQAAATAASTLAAKPAPASNATGPAVAAPANSNRMWLIIGGSVVAVLFVIAVIVSVARGMKPPVTIAEANSKGDAAFQQKDYATAVTWYLKAAEQGDAMAEYNLGWIYDNGGNGVAQDYAQALNWYTKSANQGDKDAENNLGEMYYYGRGTTVDYATAFHWYTLAANQGEENAEYSLGWLYANGQGVTEDDNLARTWMSRSAAQGKQDAINWLQSHSG
ncbi:MAG TPA: TIR domain-containing protein [Caulobacteraceae bacterium]|nr:TIR domain-containing protein [Caulobacteraceae bacterium]